MNISCHEITLESKRKRFRVKLNESREAVIENFDKRLMKSVNIFDRNLEGNANWRGQKFGDLAKFPKNESH